MYILVSLINIYNGNSATPLWNNFVTLKFVLKYLKDVILNYYIIL